jgi:predicted ABC-type ATPase
MPRVFVIAGPNGAGKTTASAGLLPELLGCNEFVNADAIARALSPFNPERVAWRAGRLMLEVIRQLADSGEDFAFETTLASRTFVPFLRKCQGKGYTLSLIFLWLRSASLAERRVAARVLSGGHKVPRQVIRRRYRNGIHNFWTLYAPLADHWVVYDNSGPAPELVARGHGPDQVDVVQSCVWRLISGMKP